MFSQNNVRSITRKAEQPFNVIESFATLSAQRKLLLCESLSTGNGHSFQQTVRLLWPEATQIDIKNLANLLRLLQKTAHQ